MAGDVAHAEEYLPSMRDDESGRSASQTGLGSTLLYS